MNRIELLSEIRRYINRLERPLLSSDTAAGWDPANQADAIKMFMKIENELEAGGCPKPSLIRTMDSWGITDGELLRNAAEIENYLSTLAD